MLCIPCIRTEARAEGAAEERAEWQHFCRRVLHVMRDVKMGGEHHTKARDMLEARARGEKKEES